MPACVERREAACVVVTTDGWLGVQRAVVLLSARGYAVDAFTAARSAGPRSWEVRIVLHCPPAELPLLQARLERLPSVTAVETVSAGGDGP